MKIAAPGKNLKFLVSEEIVTGGEIPRPGR
jgi:hypothetical protein